jgi:sugar lactone lactonase YvrE
VLGVASAHAAAPPAPGYTETVARIAPAMPAGIALDIESRAYVSFPNWDKSPPPYALARVGRDGRLQPYPSTEAARYDEVNPRSLVSVLGIRADQTGRLWVLDNARPRFEPARPGSIKLLAFDTRTGGEVQRFVFPPSVADPQRAFLNDLVIDRGTGTIFISDMSTDGRGAIVVYDPRSDRAWRALDGHPALSAEAAAIFIERKPVPLNGGIDGIALSADGKWLYWKALAGRGLYRISTDLLRSPETPDSSRAAAIEPLGDAPVTDGMFADAGGKLYFTSLEHSSIIVRRPNGGFETLTRDPRIVWPDSIDLARNGWLYLVSNQINRMPLFNDGKDMRRPPYYLLRIWTGQP